MGGVVGLEHLGQRLAVARVDAQPFGRVRRLGDFVAQGLEQAAHAVVVLRRAQEDRGDLTLAQGFCQLLVNLLLGRNDVLEQLLQQVVVEVSQVLQELGPGGLLPPLHVLGRGDQLRGLTGAVRVSPPARQIDIAGDRLALADRHLAQHQRWAGDRSQGFQHLPDPTRGGIHLVNEDQVRDGLVLQELEQRRHHERAFHHRLANDHRGIDHLQHVPGFLDHLDRPRAVQEGPPVPEIFGRRGRDLDTHLALTRLRGAVADGVAFLDRALAANRPGDEEHAFKQGRLAAAIGSDESRAAGRRWITHLSRSLVGFNFSVPGLRTWPEAGAGRSPARISRRLSSVIP